MQRGHAETGFGECPPVYRLVPNCISPDKSEDGGCGSYVKMCASHSPTHDAASRRLLRHRETQIRPQPQCVCGLARTANSGCSRMEIRPDGMAPLHNYDLCIILVMESFP
jgi:hypothetical protein